MKRLPFWTYRNRASLQCIRHFVRAAAKRKADAAAISPTGSNEGARWVREAPALSVKELARADLNNTRHRAKLGMATGQPWDRPAHNLWLALNPHLKPADMMVRPGLPGGLCTGIRTAA